jgi:hypothetical protein
LQRERGLRSADGARDHGRWNFERP